MSKNRISVEAMMAEQTPLVDSLRRDKTELLALLEKAKSSRGLAEDIMDQVRSAIVTAKPKPVSYKPDPTSGAACSHVVQLSDIHYGAVTNKDEVDGFGEFSPEIAEERIKFLGQKIIDQTTTMRSGFNIPTLRVIGTADYISGDIHPELQSTNAFPAPEQAVKCGYMLGAFLAGMAPHFESVVADFITLDNHGRLTKKPQSADGGANNYGYVVAEIAKQHCAAQSNIEVRVHAKPSALIMVGPEKYLAFHGHQIKGWAGKPYYGFDRRVAMEAVKRMGIPEQAFTKLLFGHFHHAFNGDCWIMGGSLSGTDAFDHSQGRHSKPHQTSWLVHPKHGEFAWTRWWL